ncbi:MAG: type II toxin-antitoxin system RelE/ParE family toxin [Pseudonocardiaceae bacterium]
MKLSTHDAARTRFYLQLLTEHGSTLGMPYSRSLGNGLRELRFHLRDEQRRITFWIAPDRRIVLLTTFRKQRQNERREVERSSVPTMFSNKCNRSSTDEQATRHRRNLHRTGRRSH